MAENSRRTFKSTRVIILRILRLITVLFRIVKHIVRYFFTFNEISRVKEISDKTFENII